jgi:hypothetical protein
MIAGLESNALYVGSGSNSANFGRSYVTMVLWDVRAEAEGWAFVVLF